MHSLNRAKYKRGLDTLLTSLILVIIALAATSALLRFAFGTTFGIFDDSDASRRFEEVACGLQSDVGISKSEEYNIVSIDNSEGPETIRIYLNTREKQVHPLGYVLEEVILIIEQDANATTPVQTEEINGYVLTIVVKTANFSSITSFQRMDLDSNLTLRRINLRRAMDGNQHCTHIFRS